MKSIFRFSFLIFLFAILQGRILPQAEVDSDLLSILQNATVPVEAVVTFNGDGTPTESQMNLLRQAGITVGFSFQSLPIAGVLINLQQVEALASNSEIRSIYFNKELEYYNYNGTALTGVDKLRSDQTLTSMNGGMPVSGKGVTVLINDSGVDGTHADLEYGTHLIQNALGSTNPHAYEDITETGNLLPIVYVENVPNTDNNSGHGTHCAGIVGGTGVRSGGRYEGVASGATLMGYGSGAVLLVLDALGGFDYALTHQYEYGIRVITNSWGSSGNFSPDNPVNVASKKAYDRNIVVLFSAGNSGPGEATVTPYSAPWVITVAAGDKYGALADFSSRGVRNDSYTFSLKGQTWTYENGPTITAPGVDVISCRATGLLPVLGADTDAEEIEPGYLPFYTGMSGTSMSCPHAAGIVALMLDANPSLSASEVKNIIEKTATNMPGYEPWETGAGYINAYAAVDYVFQAPAYGSTVNKERTFNSNVITEREVMPFSVDYYPVPELSPTQNQFDFNIPAGLLGVEVDIDTYGLLGLIGEGNTVNLVLISPDGIEYSSGITLLFTLEYLRTVVVADPQPGDWTVELRGLRGDELNPTDGWASPEEIFGEVKLTKAIGYTGLNDISGYSAESSVKLAINSRLVDGFSDGTYRPNDLLNRYQLADYLVMGKAVRQHLPTNGTNSFSDINPDQKLIVESVTSYGSVLRDRFYEYRGVILPTGPNQFSPDGNVSRVDVAYAMVQSLGLEAEALSYNGQQVTVNVNGEDIPVEDANQISSGFEGYVQVALNLNLINAYFTLEQGPFDLEPTVHATFNPLANVTRGEFAVIVTRTHNQWTAAALGKQNTGEEVVVKPETYSLDQNYPNPFNPTTTISFSIPEDDFVSIEIYNSIGEKVQTLLNEFRQAGTYNIYFNAGSLASGIYLYRIKTANFEKTMKMNLLK